MGEVSLRPKARSDLGSIWDYTVEAWGEEQAERYLRALNQAFETLAERPRLGRLYDEVREGLRVYPSGRHLIFFFVTEGGIDVARVLHERMDVPSRL